MRTLFFLHILIFSVKSSLACNSPVHHSILSHYNHASAVFIGQVILIKKEKKAYLRILKTYKNNTKDSSKIWIHYNPNQYLKLSLDSSYLVYANLNFASKHLNLVRAIALSDSIQIKKNAFLAQIPYQYTGEITEYSPYGKIRAKGYLKEGLAEGKWRYFGWSGELQIEGEYINGEENGLWQYYYHTLDRNYKIIHKIIQGIYYQQTGQYQFVRLDTLKEQTQRFCLYYLLDNQEISEPFYYHQRQLQKSDFFCHGRLHGPSITYDIQGDTMDYFHHNCGQLDGPFYKKLISSEQKNITIIARGYYQRNKKKQEIHFFYENGQLYETKVIQGKQKKESKNEFLNCRASYRIFGKDEKNIGCPGL